MAPMKGPARRASRDSYSLTQLARRWQWPRREVRKLLQHGRLPFIAIRGQLRVPRQAVVSWEATDDDFGDELGDQRQA